MREVTSVSVVIRNWSIEACGVVSESTTVETDKHRFLCLVALALTSPNPNPNTIKLLHFPYVSVPSKPNYHDFV